MTVQTIAIALHELAAILEAARATTSVGGVRMLAGLFDPTNKSAVATFLKRATPKCDVGATWTGQRVGDLLPVLDASRGLLERLASKSSAKEFGLVVEWLDAHRAAGLSEFATACLATLGESPASKKKPTVARSTNELVVADYAARLKKAIGSDGEFASVFEALKSDKTARKQEVAEIMKRIMREAPTNPDRKGALKAIAELHRASMGFDNSVKAMSGRSAA